MRRWLTCPGRHAGQARYAYLAGTLILADGGSPDAGAALDATPFMLDGF